MRLITGANGCISFHVYGSYTREIGSLLFPYKKKKKAPYYVTITFYLGQTSFNDHAVYSSVRRNFSTPFNSKPLLGSRKNFLKGTAPLFSCSTK
jgi:hypothetical protein